MIGIDALVIAEIPEDDNFLTLSQDKTSAEEFTRLLGEHVIGYSQKKRLSEALKDLQKKVEDTITWNCLLLNQRHVPRVPMKCLLTPQRQQQQQQQS